MLKKIFNSEHEDSAKNAMAILVQQVLSESHKTRAEQ